MIILDFIFKSFYSFLVNYGERGKQAALIPLSIAMSCIAIFILSYIFALIGESYITTVTLPGFAIFGVVLYFSFTKWFEIIYLKNKREINLNSHRILYVLSGLILLFGGSFLLVISFRYA